MANASFSSPNDDFPTQDGWLRPEYGLERRYATVCNFQMSYIAGGKGEPVVLLHGLGADNSTWRKVLPELAEHFTVYAIDMFGCGQSDKPVIEYTVEAMAHYVRLFMDAVGIEQAHIIGHSLGGGIAMQTLYFSPERVRRVVLADTGGLGRDVHWLLRMTTLPGAHSVIGMLTDPRSRLLELLAKMEEYEVRRLNAEFESEIPMTLGRLRDPATRRSFLRMIRAVGGLGGQTVSALARLPERADRQFLLIWGERDRIIPASHGRIATTLLPNAHLAVIPDCFHQPQIEYPRRFLQLALDFLQAESWPPDASLFGPPAITSHGSRAQEKQPAPAIVALSGLWTIATHSLMARLRRRVAPAGATGK
ncbi:MAG TPA: alpha/beta fold hydrolase [Ktedonobacterales bacterium]|nr:alpha/beta fold hydrolase [Ktedonobacterales bacterium]